MAVIPKKSSDFDVVRGSDFPLTLTLKASGSAMNLSGYTIAGEVYSAINDGKTKIKKYADWNITITSSSTGVVDISLSDTQTKNFNLDVLFYDIKLTQPNNDKFVYLRGKLNMLEGYTE